MKLTEREKRLVFIAVFFIAVFVYYFYYLSPFLDEYMVLKETEMKKQEKLDHLNQTQQEQEVLKRKIEEYKGEIARLENILPSSMRLPEIIVSLEEMAKTSGVQLEEMFFSSFGKEIGEEKDQSREYLEIPIQLTVSGTYENELKFLKLLEDSPRIYKVNNISVVQAFQNSVENIRLNIGLSTFAILHNNQLFKDFENYDFMTGQYGRTNPFSPVNKGNSLAQGSGSAAVNANKNDEKVDWNQFMEDFLKVVIDKN
ncbi:MAG: type 4a pilus biogenesis protein PilO [Clostridia bacterium]|nr:type 4a pilus biogenesis protein PilO [Clostridia bacterium]